MTGRKGKKGKGAASPGRSEGARGAGAEGGSGKGVGWDGVPPRLRGILTAVPVRNEDQLKWERNGEGLVVITHAKNLGRMERWLMKKLGGSPIVKRKLDRPGSDIWALCDGEHTVAEICDAMDRKYQEDIEPVLTRVVKFLEILLTRNLVYFKPREPLPGTAPGGASGPAPGQGPLPGEDAGRNGAREEVGKAREPAKGKRGERSRKNKRHGPEGKI